MRIVSGALKGRTFQPPAGHKTHPMSEKMRGAIFNVLGDIEGLSILDAYAGSGALGFEAVSRGAKHATLVEVDKTAHSQIMSNIRSLQLHSGKIKAIRASAGGWSDNNPGLTYDLVFSDPPYDGLNLAELQKITRHVVESGLLVLSWPGALKVPELMGMNKLEEKGYGDSKLVFYRRISV